MAFLVTGVACGGEDDAKKLSKQLPLLFWYTGELWGELERGASTGESSDEFCKSKRTKFTKLDETEDSLEYWKFHLYYEEDEGNEDKEGWIFVFSYDGAKWSEVSGARITGGSTYRLLEADAFTPSMRPQMRQALELYNTGKLAEVAASPAEGGDEGDEPGGPVYSVLLGEGLSGSGFHFAVGEKRYIACTLHQFEGKTPAVMGSIEFEDSIKVTGRVYAGTDIQVLTYDSASLDKLAPLSFDVKETPEVGDKVYCYNFDESYAGEITAIAADQRNYTVKMTKPYPAGGNSGAPIVSAETGTVVGVLLSADDTEAATIVGFELLKPVNK